MVKKIIAFIYFVVLMIPTILVLAMTPFIALMDIQTIRSIGFSTTYEIDWSIVGVLGLFLGISQLVPAFRKMYYVLPWLFPFVKIMFINAIIFTAAVQILSYGYEVQNGARHTWFYILMIVQLIVCRLAMSYYFYKRPVTMVGGGHERK